MSRGQSIVAMPLSELLSIILVAVLVIGVGIFLVRAVFATNANAEAASIDSTLSLAHIIRELVAKPDFYLAPTHTIYLGPKVVLVGFNNAQNRPKETQKDEGPTVYCGSTNQNKFVGRPNQCSAQACLCLYREEDACVGAQPLTCAQLSGVDTVLSFWQYNGETSFGQKYNPSIYAKSTDADKADNTFTGQCYPWVTGTKYVRLLEPHLYEDTGTTIFPAIPYFDSTLIDAITIDYKAFTTYYFSAEDKKKEVANNQATFCGGQDQKYANQYSSLVIFGEQYLNGDEFKTSTITVEKAIIDGQTRILVAYKLPDALVKSRRERVQAARIDEIAVLAKNEFTKNDFATAINLYSEYIIAAQTNNFEDSVIKSAFEQLYRAHEGNARDEKATIARRIESLHYLLANYEQLIVRLPAYNYANTELAVLCAKSSPGDTACAGIPKVSATFSAVENGACDGVVELERCTADPKTKLACVNNVWTKAPCGYDCQNSYTSDGKLQVLC